MAIQIRALVTATPPESAVGVHPRDLTALGVTGLRMSDLHADNIACCGDCRFLTLRADSAGGSYAVCQQGYPTTLYATWAAHCPAFSLHAPLPDTPQGDERSGHDRRRVSLPVIRERRMNGDRRARRVPDPRASTLP